MRISKGAQERAQRQGQTKNPQNLVQRLGDAMDKGERQGLKWDEAWDRYAVPVLKRFHEEVNAR